MNYLPEQIRRCVFRPYRKGMGPVFALTMWDTHRQEHGKWMVKYRLTMACRKPVCSSCRTVLFDGEDYGCSPCHAIDSDESVSELMTFLTCKPGDTDREYFANYTAEQLDYCSQHAEALDSCVRDRFGDR